MVSAAFSDVLALNGKVQSTNHIHQEHIRKSMYIAKNYQSVSGLIRNKYDTCMYFMLVSYIWGKVGNHSVRTVLIDTPAWSIDWLQC